jgi:hypothetical protein
MLQPEAPALKREEAIQVLAELERLQVGLRQVIQQCEALIGSG